MNINGLVCETLSGKTFWQRFPQNYNFPNINTEELIIMSAVNLAVPVPSHERSSAVDVISVFII
jgi:hypothetical protein